MAHFPDFTKKVGAILFPPVTYSGLILNSPKNTILENQNFTKNEIWAFKNWSNLGFSFGLSEIFTSNVWKGMFRFRAL